MRILTLEFWEVSRLVCKYSPPDYRYEFWTAIKNRDEEKVKEFVNLCYEYYIPRCREYVELFEKFSEYMNILEKELPRRLRTLLDGAGISYMIGNETRAESIKKEAIRTLIYYSKSLVDLGKEIVDSFSDYVSDLRHCKRASIRFGPGHLRTMTSEISNLRSAPLDHRGKAIFVLMFQTGIDLLDKEILETTKRDMWEPGFELFDYKRIGEILKSFSDSLASSKGTENLERIQSRYGRERNEFVEEEKLGELLRILSAYERLIDLLSPT